ncbi:hypothetical protein BDZ89DRAFT_1041765 [Hymenopellis radicata]|nr:hypothetical protein BDZ89DRAFT_1041765 [Hymenopellis radicata]
MYVEMESTSKVETGEAGIQAGSGARMEGAAGAEGNAVVHEDDVNPSLVPPPSPPSADVFRPAPSAAHKQIRRRLVQEWARAPSTTKDIMELIDAHAEEALDALLQPDYRMWKHAIDMPRDEEEGHTPTEADNP